jgi:4-diphosphocytidyl-2-C-methyl-D-erythritol kinase
MIRRRAHAKINLFLRVLGAREDGYHEIESLVTPISLADLVVVRPAGRLRVEVEGAPAFAAEGPAGGLNLALVAALASPTPAPTRRARWWRSTSASRSRRVSGAGAPTPRPRSTR